jgi:hypothetical protein
MVKLEEFNCVRVKITGNIPYDDSSWKKILSTIDRKKVVIEKERSKIVSIRSIFISSEKNVDYHYHFAVDKFKDKRLAVTEFEIGLHLNSPNFKQVVKKKILPIADLATWLSNLLGYKFEKRNLDLKIETSFIFKKPAYDSVLPVPFKSPFESLAGKNILGEVSISGLKFKLEQSEIGLKTIYFETFPKFMAIKSFFKQKIILNTGTIENFIKSAAGIAALFVKKQEKGNVRKKA